MKINDKKNVVVIGCCMAGLTALISGTIVIGRKYISPSESIAGVYIRQTSAMYRNEVGLGYAIPIKDMETEVEYSALNSEFESFELSEAVIETAVRESAQTETAFLDKFHPTLRTQSDEELIMMNENEMWSYLTNGLITGYPQDSFTSLRSGLEQLLQTNGVMIRVPVWYWKYPNDDTNFEKIKQYKTFRVNKAIAQLFQHAFEDIFNDESKPVINIADTGAGCWVIRGKASGASRISTHAIGAAIDINPGTGSFNINGTWYGNGYRHQTVTKELWEQLPECHNKYNVLYDGSPIVNIFKSYGFVWGGDWKVTKDCMHLSFIGEGQGTRERGQSYYLQTLED